MRFNYVLPPEVETTTADCELNRLGTLIDVCPETETRMLRALERAQGWSEINEGGVFYIQKDCGKMQAKGK